MPRRPRSSGPGGQHSRLIGTSSELAGPAPVRRRRDVRARGRSARTRRSRDLDEAGVAELGGQPATELDREAAVVGAPGEHDLALERRAGCGAASSSSPGSARLMKCAASRRTSRSESAGRTQRASCSRDARLLSHPNAIGSRRAGASRIGATAASSSSGKRPEREQRLEHPGREDLERVAVGVRRASRRAPAGA